MADSEISSIPTELVNPVGTERLYVQKADGTVDYWLAIKRLIGEWVVLAADYALGNNTNLQKLFNATTNGALTLEAGIYEFDSLIYLTGMSATSGNALFDILGAGNATLGNVKFNAVGIDNTTPTTAATQTGCFATTKATGAAINTAGTGTALADRIGGVFNVTVGGTIIPSIQLLTASAASVKAGSYFKCRRLGDTGNAYNGAWG